MIMPLLQWIVPDLARRKSNEVQRVFSSGGTAHAVVRNPPPSQVKLKTLPLRLKGSAIPLALTRDCVRSFAHIGPVLLLPFYWMDCIPLELCWCSAERPMGIKFPCGNALRKPALLFLLLRHRSCQPFSSYLRGSFLHQRRLRFYCV
jgi:hypothetical protein